MEAEYRVILERKYQTLLKNMQEYLPSVDERLLLDAYEFAITAHGSQTRKSGEPYVIHPIEVALIISQMNLDFDSIIAALLHDILEDTRFTFGDIKSRFGASVAHLVEGVTKLSKVNYTSKEEHQMENLRKMFLAMARDIRVILVKLADRLHNMRTIIYQSEPKRREVALETMEIYAPIAHRLGMQKIKWELEDLALQQLDPIGHAEILSELEETRWTHESFLEQIQETITQRLAEAEIENPSISSRIKHVYSIYRKLMGQRKAMFEIYDLYAVRIIVDTIGDCYNVMGLMHDLYKPLPGRIKDYIATPKPNMYQSLHTTVIGREGQPFEIQIRTWDMHRTAEYGIAAHWKYKQGVEGADKSEDRMAWVRSLLESQQDTDAEDFIRAIKVDMFADEVYVFTPGADVINLPAGAGPIDFAYAIHSAVGNRMSGAKVGGRIVSLDYALQNGDIVEILTSNNHGPSRDWLKLVKTSEARNKIKQWFKKERRDENVAQGRLELERELKRTGIPYANILQEDILSAVLKKMSMSCLDDLLAAIGYGGITINRAIGRFRDELVRQNRLQLTDKAAADKSIVDKISSAPKRPRKAISGVIVEDLDNCLIKFARCCAPVPGDNIVGYVTRGYGVSVHRAECFNVRESLSQDQGRRVEVSWAETIKDTYQTGLQIRCHDRDGLVIDAMGVLNNLKIKALGMSAKSVDSGMAILNLRMEVDGVTQLSDLMSGLRQIPGVIEIIRKDVDG